MTDSESPLPIASSSAMSGAGNLVIASNRLPIRLQISDSGWRAHPSSGGLASALSGIMGSSGLTWVGWPGCTVPQRMREQVSADLADGNLAPVFLTPNEEEDYYHGICNQVLWPLFHYFSEKVDFQAAHWDSYVSVNRKFADAVIANSEHGGKVWIHDFHLMLAPQMIRERRPDLGIGFFLHIPFPSSEIYRLLPTREELMRGVLAADYIGFHTYDYARHFRASCLRVLGLESEQNHLVYEGRRIGLGVHPIGVDTESFEFQLHSKKVQELSRELRGRYGNRKLILGVERLDYTKGISLKLDAFERLLEQDPDIASEVTLLQLLVPSRLANPDYQELKSEIEEQIGRINGRYGRPGITPVEYMHRNLALDHLVALYRAADVCLVTPVRDGMNLVAQEYVLCQQELEDDPDFEPGVLLLSEFAGAAQCMSRALLTNPWDVEKTAESIQRALFMGAEEKQARTRDLVTQTRAMDCKIWAEHFLQKMNLAVTVDAEGGSAEPLSTTQREQVLDRFAGASQRRLFLDYDGTLREIARTPEEAAPTDEIRDLLRELGSLPDTEVHLISGRHREDLEGWFGDLPIYLSAEHGFTERVPGGRWHTERDVDLSWMPGVHGILSEVAEDVPGTRMEVKPSALAWHYRMADLDYGVWRARELHSQLESDLAHLPVDILHGHRVIEIRARGITKGDYVRRALGHGRAADFVLCMGDDRTDQDMYRALPEDAFCIHVGKPVDDAPYTIESPARVRELLGELARHLSSTGA